MSTSTIQHAGPGRHTEHAGTPSGASTNHAHRHRRGVRTVFVVSGLIAVAAISFSVGVAHGRSTADTDHHRPVAPAVQSALGYQAEMAAIAAWATTNGLTGLSPASLAATPTTQASSRFAPR